MHQKVMCTASGSTIAQHVAIASRSTGLNFTPAVKDFAVATELLLTEAVASAH